MSIRLRFTLLYNVILALTLAIFGMALYASQAHSIYDTLKSDLIHTNSLVGTSVQQSISSSGILVLPSETMFTAPPPLANHPLDDKGFKKIPEREIVRILDLAGNLVASPFGRTQESLPLSAEGLRKLQNKSDWWQEAVFQEQHVLVFSHPMTTSNNVTYIIQVARPLTDRERTLSSLALTLLIASLLTILLAVGIGWLLSGVILAPIQRMTHTAQAIGEDRDFTRRVAYSGPQDEVGQLASTFNNMLERLQAAYQQVAHSLEMQRDFVADVSHELRTPLTTLRGNLGLLRRTPPIPKAEQQDILADMTDESDRMIRLVNDLLILARADAGRSLSRESFAVQPLLEETCRQARLLDPQREISLSLPAQSADELGLMGDRDAFKQVLFIALDNALKHTTARVHVSAQRSAGRVELRVQDEGPGMDPEKLNHLFDRFYRGEDASTIPGFGLGLPIARSLVIAMGGEIRMESQPGQGSCLVLLFSATTIHV